MNLPDKKASPVPEVPKARLFGGSLCSHLFSLFFDCFDVGTVRSLRNSRDNIVYSGLPPEMVKEVDMRSADEMAIIATVTGIKRKKVPYIRFVSAHKEMKNGSSRILGKLIVKLAKIVRCSDLLASIHPKMVNVIVLEDGCVEISERPAPNNHMGYVRVSECKLMTELHRFALLGYGEKLRKILGRAIFVKLEKCINHGNLDDLIFSANVPGQESPPASGVGDAGNQSQKPTK